MGGCNCAGRGICQENVVFFSEDAFENIETRVMVLIKGEEIEFTDWSRGE